MRELPGWPAYATRAPVLVGDELLVCEWQCKGQARPWFREDVEHAELDLPQQGAHLRSAGRQRHVVDVTSAAFSHAGDSYLRASPSPRPATSTLIAMRGELARSVIPRDAGRAFRVPPDVAALHLHLVRAQDPVDAAETALRIVGRLVAPVPSARASAQSVSPAWLRLADEIRHLIALQFAERLTLERIGRVCQVSPFHASHVFRAVTGETIHRHLTRVRLRSAALQLRHSARLADIAITAGFSSHSHFTSAFRAEFGCAPSQLAARPRARPWRA